MKAPMQADGELLRSETRLADLLSAGSPGVSLTVSSAWIAAATLGCWVLAGPVAYLVSGSVGLLASGAAGLCCSLGAFGTLMLTHWFRGPTGLLPRVLGGMFIRMAVPLAAAMGVQLSQSPLADAGFLYYLLMFYLVTLAVETGLWVRHG